jgi:hypothetical protein
VDNIDEVIRENRLRGFGTSQRWDKAVGKSPVAENSHGGRVNYERSENSQCQQKRLPKTNPSEVGQHCWGRALSQILEEPWAKL